MNNYRQDFRSGPPQLFDVSADNLMCPNPDHNPECEGQIKELRFQPRRDEAGKIVGAERILCYSCHKKQKMAQGPRERR